MKKVLQIIPQLYLGGAEVMCKHLSIALKEAGCEVMVVSLFATRTILSEELEKAGVPVVYLDKKSGFDITILKKLRKIVKDFDPDVIHTHTSAMKYTSFATVGIHKHMVHTMHCLAQYECGFFLRELKKLYAKTKNITFVGLSKIVAKTIHDVYKIPMEKIPVVHNGIPLETCKVKTDWSLHKPIAIAHVAGFRLVKNHPAVMKAIRKLLAQGYPVKIYLYGDGEERENIEAFTARNHMEAAVELCGVCEDVLERLHDCDILVLPSWGEGFPLSVIEAMGTGLPVVASPVGGIPDMITDGEDGLFCEPNEDSLAEKIAMLIDDPDLRMRIGQQAIRSAERFSATEMAKGYLAVYENK